MVDVDNLKWKSWKQCCNVDISADLPFQVHPGARPNPNRGCWTKWTPTFFFARNEFPKLAQTNLLVHIHRIEFPLCVDVQVIQHVFRVQHQVCKVNVVTVVVVVSVPGIDQLRSAWLRISTHPGGRSFRSSPCTWSSARSDIPVQDQDVHLTLWNGSS